MEYENAIMSFQELRKLGFPRTYLERAYRNGKNTFAHKIDPTKKNSAILYDTAGFEKWRQGEIRAQRGRA